MKNPNFDFNKTMQEIMDNECVMSALVYLSKEAQAMFVDYKMKFLNCKSTLKTAVVLATESKPQATLAIRNICESTLEEVLD